ncbi:MAG: ribosomal protein L7/L12 [Lachnospiraceae bacterium]|nr:ribosomal protein L7/L12 [Lachnospiraceae bacterium]
MRKKTVKKKLGTLVLVTGVLVGLCACGKEPASTESPVEEQADMGPYREWIQKGTLQNVTLSVKIPEKWLVYEEAEVGTSQDQVIHATYYVNDGGDVKMQEMLSVSLYEQNGLCPGNLDRFEYAIDSLKDYYDFELVEEKEEGNSHTLFLEGKDKDFDPEDSSLSDKYCMVAKYVKMDNMVFCCKVEFDYLYKEQEEIAGFEEFEEIVDSVKLEVLQEEEAAQNPTVETPVSENVTAETSASENVIAESLTNEGNTVEVTTSESTTAESQTYYVKLLEAGDSKLKVIQVYREVTDAGLADAKAAVEAAPCLVIETTSLEEAESIAQAFRDVGATIDEDMTSEEFGSSNGEAANPAEASGSGNVGVAGTEAVEVYAELNYPEDDWRSAGFYVDGQYAQLPMSYQELCELGFDQLLLAGQPEKLEECDAETKENYTLPAYSINMANSIDAGNEKGDQMRIYLVNVTGEEQWIPDNTVYSIQAYKPTDTDAGVQDIKLCNGVTWGTTYEEVLELMGDADKVQDVSNGNGFDGTLIYYLEEGRSVRKISIHFFRNQVDSFVIDAKPIDAHVLTR